MAAGPTSSSIDDIRDGDHPLQSLQRDYLSVKSIFHIGGAPLQIATEKLNGSGELPIPAEAIGGFIDLSSPPSQRDDSNLRVDASAVALEPRSGAFYRIAVAATGVGTITAGTEFVNGIGLGMQGTIPHDWFELVSGSVEVVAAKTNLTQPEDVNQDSVVSAVDALIVINALNDAPQEAESRNRVVNIPDSYMWDVNGDGLLAPIDALLVVNYLNDRQPVASIAAEGEASVTAPPPALYALLARDDRNDTKDQRAKLIDEVMLNGEDYLSHTDRAANLASDAEAPRESHRRIWYMPQDAADEEGESDSIAPLTDDTLLTDELT